jgi:WD40-like Beta Propeller Repeat
MRSSGCTRKRRIARARDCVGRGGGRWWVCPAVFPGVAARHVERGFQVFVRCLLLVAALLPLTVSSTAQATTPGTNGRIVFVRDVVGNSEVYSMNPDGSAARRLTWTFFDDESAPDWSPDGSRIVYARFAADGGLPRIWVMNADGSGQTQVTFSANTMGGDYEPRWSPDGSTIVFASTRSDAWNLWLVNPDGSGLRRLSSVWASEPSWSPDGSRLAYANGNGISVIGRDGSNPHAITGIYTYTPSWSPDGSRVLFSRSDGHLYTVNVDGSGEQQLTSGAFRDGGATWSPDGSQIAFDRASAGSSRADLWTIAADSSNARQLTTNGDGAGAPSWGSSQVVPEPTPPAAPQIDIAQPADGGGYLPGTITAWYLCLSAVSFIVSCDGDVPSGEQLTLISAGSHTFTVRATDAEGRTATRTVSFEVPDVTPPTITLRLPTDGAVYEQGSNVTIDYGCADPNGDGTFFCQGDRPDNAPLDTSQLGLHTFNVYAGDDAGHVAQTTVTYRVAGPPLLTLTSPADGALYPLNASIQTDYSCNDQSGEGISSCLGDQLVGTALDTSQLGSHTFTVTGVDNAGHNSSKTVTYKVVGPPLVQISSPVAGALYPLGTNVTASYACSAYDIGAPTCIGDVPSGGTLNTTTAGSKTFTVTATDSFGQTTARTIRYVVNYPFTGFDSPVGSGVLAGAKAGEPVPLKFSLNGNRGNNVVTALTWQPTSCTDNSTSGSPATGSGNLSYTTSTGRYVESVNTDKSWKGTCRTLTLQLTDTTTHRVTVHFN